MKETEKNRNMSGRRVIQSRGFGYRPEKEFFLEIEEAVLQGYRVAQNYRMDDLCGRNVMGGIGQVVMYKDGNEFLEDMQQNNESTQSAETKEENKEKNVDSKQTLEDEIKALSKKVDCVDFAKEHNLEIPEDKKTVPVIKKYFKDSLLSE